jgi:hypothetical protein
MRKTLYCRCSTSSQQFDAQPDEVPVDDDDGTSATLLEASLVVADLERVLMRRHIAADLLARLGGGCGDDDREAGR